jgi:hypothetical protein
MVQGLLIILFIFVSQHLQLLSENNNEINQEILSVQVQAPIIAKVFIKEKLISFHFPKKKNLCWKKNNNFKRANFQVLEHMQLTILPNKEKDISLPKKKENILLVTKR